MMDIEKIKEEFGYDGKSAQWKLGFDSLLRHIDDYVEVSNTENITHRGLRQDRIQEEGSEKIFADVWEETNVRRLGTNNGYTALELILNKFNSNIHFAYPNPNPEDNFIPPTQRDADVASTVIQWLGTKCGACLLFEAENRIFRTIW